MTSGNLRLRCFAAYTCATALLLLASASRVHAQSALDPLAPAASTPATTSPLLDSATPPGTLFLFDLEKKFAADVLKNGGKAYAAWFAEDGVEIPDKKAPVVGRAALEAMAQWDPRTYQLSWTPQGGMMLPSNNSGYTWGHYEARATDAFGKVTVTTGRFISLWKKQSDGSWKVALDTSNEEPADCGCTVPVPGSPTAAPKP